MKCLKKKLCRKKLLFFLKYSYLKKFEVSFIPPLRHIGERMIIKILFRVGYFLVCSCGNNNVVYCIVWYICIAYRVLKKLKKKSTKMKK